MAQFCGSRKHERNASPFQVENVPEEMLALRGLFQLRPNGLQMYVAYADLGIGATMPSSGLCRVGLGREREWLVSPGIS